MVSDFKTFAQKGCKIAAQEKVSFFWQILPYYQDFFSIRATICIGQEIQCLPYAGFELIIRLQIVHKVLIREAYFQRFSFLARMM